MRQLHRHLPRLVVLLVVVLARACALANTARSTAGMVVTVQPLATDAGVDAMRRGGNAIDAAVAAAFTLGVVDGHNSGIGGGCFILIRTAKGEFVAIDGRETAPAAARRDMFVRDGKADTELSQTGALAVGVPGALSAYAYAAEHHGELKLRDLIAPAADLAERGFPIDASYAKRLAETVVEIRKSDEARRVLLKPDGSPYTAGETLKQPDLARTYRAIADQGTDYFYRGDFAKAVAQWMSANGGLITVQDLADYKLQLREPLVTTYRRYTMVGFPPPSSGGVHVAQILNILQNFDVAALDAQDPAKRVHVMAEAMKLAFADRAYWLGDPDFVNVPRGLTDSGYANDLAKRISMDHVLTNVEHGTPPNLGNVFGKHTTHLAAADAAGNWIGITTTVNTSFGSKVIVPGTGVILNNQMDDFSAQPGVPNTYKLIGGEANAIAPGKRPLSSMSPTIVVAPDGQPMMTLGAAGGPTIITQVVLALSNVIDLHDDAEAALKRPRFHHQWMPDRLTIEHTFNAKVLEKLKSLGHTLDVVRPAGATQMITRTPAGEFAGVSEPRLEGKAAGPPE
jgi:gamma-glutamyltranspeptidase/glutathione hydrolase